LAGFFLSYAALYSISPMPEPWDKDEEKSLVKEVKRQTDGKDRFQKIDWASISASSLLNNRSAAACRNRYKLVKRLTAEKDETDARREAEQAEVEQQRFERESTKREGDEPERDGSYEQDKDVNVIGGMAEWEQYWKGAHLLFSFVSYLLTALSVQTTTWRVYGERKRRRLSGT
jgi:hypothetical protein